MAQSAYTYSSTGYYDRYLTKGSLAYDIPQTAEKEKEVIRKKSKTSILDNPAKLMKIAFAVVMVGLFVILWRSATITKMNTQVNDINNRLLVLYSQNEQATVTLDRTTDLNYVEEVAKNKLNMDVPRTEQKVYVDVNVPDRAEIPVEERGVFVKGVKKFISNCLEYLY